MILPLSLAFRGAKSKIGFVLVLLPDGLRMKHISEVSVTTGLEDDVTGLLLHGDRHWGSANRLTEKETSTLPLLSISVRSSLGMFSLCSGINFSPATCCARLMELLAG